MFSGTNAAAATLAFNQTLPSALQAMEQLDLSASRSAQLEGRLIPRIAPPPGLPGPSPSQPRLIEPVRPGSLVAAVQQQGDLAQPKLGPDLAA